MNIIMWMLAGAAIGWGGYAVLHFNEQRAGGGRRGPFIGDQVHSRFGV